MSPEPCLDKLTAKQVQPSPTVPFSRHPRSMGTENRHFGELVKFCEFCPPHSLLASIDKQNSLIPRLSLPFPISLSLNDFLSSFQDKSKFIYYLLCVRQDAKSWQCKDNKIPTQSLYPYVSQISLWPMLSMTIKVNRL